jgi:hypothetical protein
MTARNDEPLIFTKHGNVPLASVDTHVEWEFGPRVDGFPESIRCRVYRTDKASGEIVADGSYNYLALGVSALAEAAIL